MKELNPVFKMLRDQGFTARQRFTCCGSCAGAKIAIEFGGRAEKDPTFDSKGFIYFHAQDVIRDEDHRRARYSTENVSMMLRFGPVEFVNHETGATRQWGLPIKEIGEAAVAALKACGIEYEWDGNPDVCITVYPLGKHKVAEQRFRAGRTG